MSTLARRGKEPLAVAHLSLVLLDQGDHTALEASLVSLLTHRPSGSEIVVVLHAPYDDPYEIAGEVQLVSAYAESLCGALRVGLSAARGAVVHVLAAGMEVEEGWTQPALQALADRNVAAVSPVVLLDDDPQRVLSAGVEYTSAGRRRDVGRGRTLLESLKPERRPAGPTWAAGFYRREELLEHCDAELASSGSAWCDVELALRLAESGRQCAFVPQSRMFAPAELLEAGPAPRRSALRRGFEAERFFRRHAAEQGWLRSLVSHGLLGLGLAARCWHPARAAELVGRLAGLISPAGRVAIDSAGPAVTLTTSDHTRPSRTQRSA